MEWETIFYYTLLENTCKSQILRLLDKIFHFPIAVQKDNLHKISIRAISILT